MTLLSCKVVLYCTCVHVVSYSTLSVVVASDVMFTYLCMLCSLVCMLLRVCLLRYVLLFAFSFCVCCLLFANVGSFVYVLTAVLRHKGQSAHSGHYTADIRDDFGNWYTFDDEQVKALGTVMDGNGKRSEHEHEKEHGTRTGTGEEETSARHHITQQQNKRNTKQTAFITQQNGRCGNEMPICLLFCDAHLSWRVWCLCAHLSLCLYVDV